MALEQEKGEVFSMLGVTVRIRECAKKKVEDVVFVVYCNLTSGGRV